ncbi:conserved hypothetical protein [Talaromyces stipitatus ATCC 10500]|uniref:DUF7924 domain-containing protein n=1 Tax=Talaromyces stipitatus (strain ATCC 10500 / CBS 375.48 / QM 6759 / NRRL 1006) TaxID=441959 RepID=B8LU64_TALSN|nr:uncharacterized protein TSTA_060310 [Talaromyces stipitatus ATCC 10500]EED22536.1 conserved hypothetical protein [Talaromyces stipitatus ATCC 10500]
MKRKVGSHDDIDKRPVKRREQESSPSTGFVNEQQQTQPQQPPSPLSEYLGKEASKCKRTANAPSFSESTFLEDRIWKWIERIPDEVHELEDMSQPPSKRSRSISTDRGRTRSVSSDASTSSRDAKSSAYKDVNYVAILGQKGCFMQPSMAGPITEDAELCERLLRQPNEIPTGTLFEDEYVDHFHNTLRNRSEARLLVDFHPLLMPSAENIYIQGSEELKHVIDGYNDPWLKTEPIHGPKPQPDHAWGLKWSAFSEPQRRKLGIEPDKKSVYAVRDDMYFPYLTAEIKCGNQALEFADRQNMHSMCIALRAVVSLARAAQCLDQVHRRILGFSISHELEDLRIYAYYPEISEGKIEYFRWSVKQFNIWSNDEKWACYRFVENVNCEFLPIHINRLNHFLEKIIDPQDIPFEGNDDQDYGSQESRIGSRERSAYSRAPSSQYRGHAELRSMIHNLQQQLEEQRAEQRAREEKLLAQMEEREEKLLTQMEEQRAEQKAREEKLLTQMEQQKAREEKLLDQLFTRLEHNEKPI